MLAEAKRIWLGVLRFRVLRFRLLAKHRVTLKTLNERYGLIATIDFRLVRHSRRIQTFFAKPPKGCQFRGIVRSRVAAKRLVARMISLEMF